MSAAPGPRTDGLRRELHRRALVAARFPAPLALALALMLALMLAQALVPTLRAASAGAATLQPPDPSPGYVVLDLPEGGDDPTRHARMRAEQVERAARLAPAMRLALTRRPGSQLRVVVHPDCATWTVNVSAGATGARLARVVIDDRTGRVTSSESTPVGRWPSRLVERTAIDAAVADPRMRR